MVSSRLTTLSHLNQVENGLQRVLRDIRVWIGEELDERWQALVVEDLDFTDEIH